MDRRRFQNLIDKYSRLGHRDKRTEKTNSLAYERSDRQTDRMTDKCWNIGLEDEEEGRRKWRRKGRRRRERWVGRGGG